MNRPLSLTTSESVQQGVSLQTRSYSMRSEVYVTLKHFCNSYLKLVVHFMRSEVHKQGNERI